MQITVERKPLEQIETEALVVPVFQDAKEARFGAAGLCDSGEITGKLLELTLLHQVAGMSAARVLLAGAGKAEKFGPAEMRQLSGAAARFSRASP